MTVQTKQATAVDNCEFYYPTTLNGQYVPGKPTAFDFDAARDPLADPVAPGEDSGDGTEDGTDAVEAEDDPGDGISQPVTTARG